jgi:MOSC domain-containing protein YiiM
VSSADLEDGLADIDRSPADDGLLELIVRRPENGAREVVRAAELDLHLGLVGDNWRGRGSRHTKDGSPDPDRQLTLVNARLAALVADDPDRRALVGDQLHVDLDLSEANLPAGSRLAVGRAVIELTAPPHTGCAKFVARFGRDAMRLVNSPEGRARRLRGANARVIAPGPIQVGDGVRKLPTA